MHVNIIPLFLIKLFLSFRQVIGQFVEIYDSPTNHERTEDQHTWYVYKLLILMNNDIHLHIHFISKYCFSARQLFHGTRVLLQQLDPILWFHTEKNTLGTYCFRQCSLFLSFRACFNYNGIKAVIEHHTYSITHGMDLYLLLI